jgi:hypothetical protein
VGVGEVVRFHAPVAGNWTATHGTAALNGNTDFDWTAPDREASPTITFTLNDGRQSTVSMDVIEPDETAVIKLRDMPAPADQYAQGAGMKLDFNMRPNKVSFRNVEIKERSGDATGISGYFLNHGMPHRHNSGDNFFRMSVNNRLPPGVEDTASSAGYPSPWSKGSFTWVVPNHFRTITEGGDGKEYTTVTQSFSITADGTTTVTKGGKSTSRTPTPRPPP